MKSLYPVFLGILLSVAFLTVTTGCGTAQLAIESEPAGAEVYVVTSGNVKQKIGNTPLAVSPAQVPAVFTFDSQIQITKDGFHSENFLIPPQTAHATSRIQTKLREDTLSKTCQDSAHALSDATDGVAQIQRMIFKKNFGEAERALLAYTVKYPSIPTFYSLLGNVYYLQKSVDRALDAYQRAHLLQPQNTDTARMVDKLKTLRSPANGGVN